MDEGFTFQQLSTTVVVERGENGHHGLQLLLEFMRETHLLAQRRNIYLDKVVNSQLSSFEIERSTSESALKQLCVTLSQESRVQAQYVDEVKDRILKPLEVLLSQNTAELEFQKAQLREVAEKAKVHNDALVKAKKELEKSSDEAKVATDKLLQLSELADEAEKLNEERRRKQKEEEHGGGGFSMKGMLRAFESTPAENRDRQRRRVERRYTAVEQCNEDILTKKATLLQTLQRRDSVMDGAIDAIQSMETRRLLQTKLSLSDIVALEKAVCERKLQQLIQLEKEVSKIDCTADLSVFINEERRGDANVKYSKALELLDEYHQLRTSNALREESSEYRDMASPSANNADVEDDGEGEGEGVSSMTPSAIHNIGDYFDSSNNSSSHNDMNNNNNSNNLKWAQPSSSSPSTGHAATKATATGGVEGEERYAAGTASAAFAAAAANADIDIHARHSWEAVFAKVDALAERAAARRVSSDNQDPRRTDTHAAPAAAPSSSSHPPHPTSASVDSFPAQRVRPQSIARHSSPPPHTHQQHLISPYVADVAQLLTRIFDTAHFGTASFSKEEYDEICVSLLGMFFNKEARSYFLQQLDLKRSRQSGVGVDKQRLLVRAFKSFLDSCSVPDDVQAAMRIANMANTFHALVSEAGSGSGSGGDGSSGSGVKVLCIEAPGIREHPIYQTEGFWEEALNAGVSAQMLNWSAEPIMWDELAPDALHGAVVAVHNIIFGQLATMSFNMREVGIPEQEVESRVVEMSRECELSQDQELQLIQTIRGYRRKGDS